MVTIERVLLPPANLEWRGGQRAAGSGQWAVGSGQQAEGGLGRQRAAVLVCECGWGCGCECGCDGLRMLRLLIKHREPGRWSV